MAGGRSAQVGRAVDRSVVDGDDLEISKALRREAGETVAEKGQTVANRQEDGDAGSRGHGF